VPIEAEIDALADAVKNLHQVKAIFVRAVEVHEKFKGQTVWHGVVSQFEIEGHPRAKTCYAWSEPTETEGKRKYFAVLAIPPVVSPETALRAAIASKLHRPV
jgi:hypothetical protein